MTRKAPMRKLGIISGIIVIIIIAAVAIFAATFDINHYRETIQADLSKRLGRNVALGEMHLSIFPPRFVVHSVSISDDPGFNTQRPFVEAQELSVSIKLLPLLHKAVDIDSLYLQKPSAELIRNQQGVWNFASLGAPSPNEPSSKPQNSSQERLSLSKLVIQNGLVATTDVEARKPRSVYDHIDLTLRDFTPGQPFSIDAAAHLPGANDQQITLSGKGGPIRQDEPLATPFHGTLNLQRVEIANARQFMTSPALAKMDGVLSGATNISSDSGKLSADGSLNVQNARVGGHDLGFPITAQYKVLDDVPGDLLRIENGAFKLGPTPLVITGTVNTKPTPAQIDVSIKGNSISIAEAARVAAMSGAALTPGTNVTGAVGINIEARGAANNPALNGTINGHDVDVSGKDVPQPVHVKTVALSLSPAEIHSDNFAVTSGGTSMNVQFALRNYTSKTSTIDGTMRAPNAELPAVLSMAKAYGVTALDKVTGAGTLNIDLHAAGPVQSAASAELVRALNGTVALNLHDVHYSGADISHELTNIAGAVGLHQGNQGLTTINKMTGKIAIRNGIAETNNIEALLDIGNVGMAGTANLGTQALDLRVTAVMAKELSQKVGGTNISGYAKTALANSEGELAIPARVTGTFQHPVFSPDLQQIAQMKLKGLVPNFNNPAAAASGILGKLLNQQGSKGAQSQNAPQEPQTQNPLQQFENIFGKKKKQPSK
jgi:AsmA protein